MTGLARVMAWAAAGSFLVASTSLHAGNTPPSAPAHEAARRFDQGVKLFEEGDFRAALIEFERAYAAVPNYRVLFDIAQCRFQLKEYAGALDAFEKYAAEGGSAISPERRKQLQSSVEELRGRVGYVKIVSDEDGLDVAIDDARIGTTPLASPVVVSAGRRKITGSKDGQSEVVRFVDVASQETVSVTLQADRRVPVAPPVDTTDASPPRQDGRSVVPVLVAFGIGAVGLGVGTIFGIAALGNKSSLDQTCVSNVCPASSQWLIDDSQRNALVSTISFAAGAAGVAAGTLLLVFNKAEDPRSSNRELNVFIGAGTAKVSGSF